MLGEGLRPSAVTRDLKWGVEVPKVGDAAEDDAMKGKVICESCPVRSAKRFRLTE
jgi:methionyl-tRNA synthetase